METASPVRLFNFLLAPLTDVKWGRGQPGRVSWFGLTEGQYWIQAGPHALFEYRRNEHPSAAAPRYCDYPVARLYEDILEMVPHVLEPVPAALVPYIQFASSSEWDATRQPLLENAPEGMEVSRYCDLAAACGSWIGNRSLESGYLRPSTRIRMWSDASTVHIEWDNRDKLINGVPAWSASLGTCPWPRLEFIREVRSLHDRLLQEMGERIAQVAAGALPDVGPDCCHLTEEHLNRSVPIDHLFAGPTVPTDWEQVGDAIGRVERGQFD